MSEERQELEKTNGIYKGRIWTRKTNSGKDQYKVTFSPNLNSDKTFSFNCFNTTKGLETLKEGEEFTIGFVTNEPYTNNAGITVSNSKTAMFFGPAESSPASSGNTNNSVNTQATKDMKSFVVDYVKTVQEQGVEPDEAHALGSYLLQFMSDKNTVKVFDKVWKENAA